jgi:hypothetical protein
MVRLFSRIESGTASSEVWSERMQSGILANMFDIFQDFILSKFFYNPDESRIPHNN